MKFNSVFDIIGPVMVGPSSSHTAGAARIGKVARDLFGKKPTWAKVHFYGSLQKTYKGFETDDLRMRDSLKIAEEKKIDIQFIEDSAATEHPNTVRIITGDGTDRLEVIGISIGGGKIEIKELNGFDLRLSGNHPAILIMHNDRAGAIASVTSILARHNINIGHMSVNRKDVGKEALMIIETDQNVDHKILSELKQADHIIKITKIDS